MYIKVQPPSPSPTIDSTWYYTEKHYQQQKYGESDRKHEERDEGFCRHFTASLK